MGVNPRTGPAAAQHPSGQPATDFSKQTLYGLVTYSPYVGIVR
jgi:hypothetical protein